MAVSLEFKAGIASVTLWNNSMLRHAVVLRATNTGVLRSLTAIYSSSGVMKAVESVSPAMKPYLSCFMVASHYVATECTYDAQSDRTQYDIACDDFGAVLVAFNVHTQGCPGPSSR